MFTALLSRMDISGAVISADAMDAHRSHAEYLARAERTLFTVKNNQPGLHVQSAAPPRPLSRQALQTITNC